MIRMGQLNQPAVAFKTELMSRALGSYLGLLSFVACNMLKPTAILLEITLDSVQYTDLTRNSLNDSFHRGEMSVSFSVLGCIFLLAQPLFLLVRPHCLASNIHIYIILYHIYIIYYIIHIYIYIYPLYILYDIYYILYNIYI